MTTDYTKITCHSCNRNIDARILKQWKIRKKGSSGTLVSLLRISDHKIKFFSLEKCRSSGVTFKAIGNYELADGPMWADHTNIGVSKSEMRDIKRMARKNWG